MKGIAKALIDFAFEDGGLLGPHWAITRAERWKTVLEEMAEVADTEQLPQIVNLLRAVDAAISNISLNTANDAMGLPREDESLLKELWEHKEDDLD